MDEYFESYPRCGGEKADEGESKVTVETMTEPTVNHAVVDHEKWLQARLQLLTREKDLRRQMDEVAQLRRNLPWERVQTDYVFDTTAGKRPLAELFGGKSQLLVYHFMLGPGWAEGCKSCSYLSDHFDPMLVHLAQRDVSFVAISRAPLPEIETFKKRMGWRFPWVSSYESSFNFDYGVSFTPEQIERGEAYYNYAKQRFGSTEAPGLSAFYLDKDGAVYHTYSTYARGLDVGVGVYNYLDMAPKGRDEGAFKMPMDWVRHHDRYENSGPVPTSSCGCEK
jgi:predicted dithiol-disulfide oxidoreductase (DUF899 family)